MERSEFGGNQTDTLEPAVAAKNRAARSETLKRNLDFLSSRLGGSCISPVEKNTDRAVSLGSLGISIKLNQALDRRLIEAPPANGPQYYRYRQRLLNLVGKRYFRSRRYLFKTASELLQLAKLGQAATYRTREVISILKEAHVARGRLESIRTVEGKVYPERVVFVLADDAQRAALALKASGQFKRSA